MNAGLRRVSLILVAASLTCFTFCGKGSSPVSLTAPPGVAEKPTPPSPFKLNVEWADIAPKFLAYLGADKGHISAADVESLGNLSPRGDGDSIPLITIANNHSFLAGEISAKGEKTQLIRISFTVSNPTQQAQQFKAGDVTLVVGPEKSSDFIAMGYGPRLCAMFDKDRDDIKQMPVNIPAGQSRHLVMAFSVANADATTGQLSIGNSTPTGFQVAHSGRPASSGNKP